MTDAAAADHDDPGHGQADLGERIAACSGMPYGRERTVLAERLVAEADAAGDAALGVKARHVLVPSYVYGPAAEPHKIFAAFAWNLARWDAAAEVFDADERHNLLWYFKWVTANVLDYPQVPWARVEATLADMRDRYDRAGEGLAPYEESRYLQATHRYGAADPRTEDAYVAWTALPRTGLSDCRACEPSARVARLAELGRHAEAVQAAAPVLAEGGCLEQPQKMIDAVLVSLLRTGRVEQAAHEHNRATRFRRRDGDRAHLDTQIRGCALVGRYGRGLDLLEEVLHQIETSPVPWNRMWLATSGVRLLGGLAAAGYGDEPVAATVPGTRFSRARPVSELLGDLRTVALDLAARFDDRNGTATVGNAVRARFDEEELPDVPSWPRTRRPRLDRRPLAVVPLQAPPAPPAQALDELALLRVEVMTTGDAEARDRLIDAWSALRARIAQEAPELLAERAAEVARLDLVGIRDELSGLADGERPGTRLRARARAARAALDSAGEVAEALLVAIHLHDVEAVVRAQAGPESVRPDLAEMDRLADAVAGTGDGAAAARAKAEVVLLAVQLAQTVSDQQAAVDARAAALSAAAAAVTAFGALDPADLDPLDRARLAFVHLVLTDGVEHPAALEILDAALALLPAGMRAYERAVLLDARAFRLVALDRLEEAAAVLDEAAAAARVAGVPGLVAQCEERAGGLLLDLGQPVEAADRLERALAEREEEGPDTPVRWRLYADLTLALGRAGRALDAADVAETVARLVAQRPPDGADPDDAFDAGRAAFVGAVSLRGLDEHAAAARLATASAQVHALHENVLARAEALDLAAGCSADATDRVRLLGQAVQVSQPAEDLWFTADLRRRHADAVDDADGPDAALALLTDLQDDLTGRHLDPDQDRVRSWHLAAIGHLRTAILLNAERFDDAVTAAAGVPEAYGDVGDDDNAVRATCLEVRALHLAGRTAEATATAREVAEEALAHGRPEHARAVGGALAQVLDDAGDPDAAEEVWARYSGDPVAD